jgi:hypothetical protein
VQETEDALFVATVIVTDDVTIQREREEFLLIGGMPADER